jgi:hypothetical protein
MTAPTTQPVTYPREAVLDIDQLAAGETCQGAHLRETDMVSTSSDVILRTSGERPKKRRYTDASTAEQGS